MEELVERASLVIGERVSIDKSSAAIEGQRRLEGRTAAGFQT
jgi:hypothetical protein